MVCVAPTSLMASCGLSWTRASQVLNPPSVTSLSWALDDVEERVSTRKVLRHGVDPRNLVRSMPPSKKPLASICDVPWLEVNGHGAGTGARLTVAHVTGGVLGSSTEQSSLPPEFWKVCGPERPVAVQVKMLTSPI